MNDKETIELLKQKAILTEAMLQDVADVLNAAATLIAKCATRQQTEEFVKFYVMRMSKYGDYMAVSDEKSSFQRSLDNLKKYSEGQNPY
jgi:hypothetical protein